MSKGRVKITASVRIRRAGTDEWVNIPAKVARRPGFWARVKRLVQLRRQKNAAVK